MRTKTPRRNVSSGIVAILLVRAICLHGNIAWASPFGDGIKTPPVASITKGRNAGSHVLALTPEEVTAIKLSLRVAIVATAVSLPIGVAIALVLARGRFVGRGLLNALVLVPLVLPPVVTGYLLLLAFGRTGPAGTLAGRAPWRSCLPFAGPARLWPAPSWVFP